VPLTDLGAALFALSGILAALHYRSRTGRGQYVDTSLVEAGIALSVWESAEYFGRGVRPEPMGSAHRLIAPYQAFRCSDGYITIGALTDAQFHRLCNLLSHPDLASDPDFADNTQRVRHRARLAERIEASTALETCATWVERLGAAGIPCGPINDYRAAFDDPQVRARGMVVTIDHPTLGATRALGSPIKMSETPPVVTRRAPLLGEHTREVLREAGCSEEEIAAVLAECGQG
jgi:formyl-CoA transferase